MNYGGYFDVPSKEQKIKELEDLMRQPNFWDNRLESQNLIDELNSLKNRVNKVQELKELINSNLELISIVDTELQKELEEQISQIDQELSNCEIDLTLNGPYDRGNAIMEIHSGAGGTEACDWAEMLKRMYFKWCEKKGYKVEIIDEQPGDEVGIKSMTALIKGENSYGYLKG